MVHNVLKEAESQALALATNRTGSEMLQELLGFSPLKPLCRLWAALSSNLRFVACHRCGVHVLQSALLQLPRLLGSPAEEEEEEEQEEEEEENGDVHRRPWGWTSQAGAAVLRPPTGRPSLSTFLQAAQPWGALLRLGGEKALPLE